jgi:hypothetical protein
MITVNNPTADLSMLGEMCPALALVEVSFQDGPDGNVARVAAKGPLRNMLC